MNTETKKWNFQDWTETEGEMFIDELKKYHNPDNKPIFYIYERAPHPEITNFRVPWECD